VIKLESTSVCFGWVLDQRACVDLERFVAVKIAFLARRRYILVAIGWTCIFLLLLL
jgi:hypothetical protein